MQRTIQSLCSVCYMHKAESQLTTYRAWLARRDAIIRDAYRAGVPKLRIHHLSGVARSTIDRILKETTMTTTIASQNFGRAIHHYDLLTEIAERHGMTDRDAHDAIHAAVEQLIQLDGEDAVIISRQPIQPELLDYNPHDLDRYEWIEITSEAANAIREAIAAAQEAADV